MRSSKAAAHPKALWWSSTIKPPVAFIILLISQQPLLKDCWPADKPSAKMAYFTRLSCLWLWQWLSLMYLFVCKLNAAPSLCKKVTSNNLFYRFWYLFHIWGSISDQGPSSILSLFLRLCNLTNTWSWTDRTFPACDMWQATRSQ